MTTPNIDLLVLLVEAYLSTGPGTHFGMLYTKEDVESDEGLMSVCQHEAISNGPTGLVQRLNKISQEGYSQLCQTNGVLATALAAGAFSFAKSSVGEFGRHVFWDIGTR